jgi:beta-lactamase regulating signal transducer with metallopeptidase domain
MTFINILFNYILPVIYDSFIALLLVVAILFIFRVRDPNSRIFFFSLPLIKPFVVIAEKVDINKIYFQNGNQTFGFRIPDPTKFISLDKNSATSAIFNSQADLIITMSVAVIIFMFLLLRWFNLAMFYKKLAYEEKVTKQDVPDIYSIIDTFSSKLKTPRPDVSLTHKKYISPFIVGLKRYTLVFSPDLLDMLSPSEKETMFQHELCHIKRRDNLIGWVTLILRDLNFFNPIAYVCYFLIRSEQEITCDRLVVKYSGKSPELVAKDILNSILKLKLTLGPNNHFIPVASSPFSVSRIFGQKRLQNRINSILNTNTVCIYSGIFMRIVLGLVFLIILLIQVVFSFKIGDFIFVLR